MGKRYNSEVMNHPPQMLQPFLWSYDLSRMDVKRDKQVIIKQVLDYGTVEATNWLRRTYSEDDIRNAIRASIRGDWGKKSLALWNLVYDALPSRENRFA